VYSEDDQYPVGTVLDNVSSHYNKHHWDILPINPKSKLFHTQIVMYPGIDSTNIGFYDANRDCVINVSHFDTNGTLLTPVECPDIIKSMMRYYPTTKDQI